MTTMNIMNIEHAMFIIFIAYDCPMTVGECRRLCFIPRLAMAGHGCEVQLFHKDIDCPMRLVDVPGG